MKKLKTILLYIMACLFIVSCHSEKIDYESTFKGGLNLASINPSLDIKVDTMNMSRASVDISSYIVKIINSKQVEVNKWNFSEMPEVVSLPVGAYSIQVLSSETPESGIDKPFYQGVQEFEIKKNELTEVAPIVCTLANIRLSISFDDVFRNLASDDLKIKLSIGESSVDLVKADEGKLAYLPALNEENMLNVELAGTIDGENINYSTQIEPVTKGYHHTIYFSFDTVHDEIGKPAGGLNVSISVDGSLTTEDDQVSVHPGQEPGIDDFPVEGGDGEDGGDEGDGGDGESSLSIVGTSFGGNPFDIDGDPLQIQRGSSVELKVALGASKGLSHVYVTIDSETLTPDILEGVGLVDNFDLAEPGDLEEGLSGLGFPVKDQVIGQESVEFDITQFTSLLGAYGAASHNFIIRIVDRDGAALTKTLKINSVE